MRLDHREVLSRVYSLLNIEKDVDFAKIIGMARSAISTHRAKGTVPTNAIVQIALERGFDLNYIFGRTKNDFSTILPILEDICAAKGSDAHLVLEQAYVQAVLQKFQDDNQNSNLIRRIFSFLGAEVEAGIYARPLLFLYYVFLNLSEHHDKGNAKNNLIEAIQKTHFSWVDFGPEFGQAWKNRIQLYIQNTMSEQECQILISNLDLTLDKIKQMLPPAMEKAHIK